MPYLPVNPHNRCPDDAWLHCTAQPWKHELTSNGICPCLHCTDSRSTGLRFIDINTCTCLCVCVCLCVCISCVLCVWESLSLSLSLYICHCEIVKTCERCNLPLLTLSWRFKFIARCNNYRDQLRFEIFQTYYCMFECTRYLCADLSCATIVLWQNSMQGREGYARLR